VDDPNIAGCGGGVVITGGVVVTGRVVITGGVIVIGSGVSIVRSVVVIGRSGAAEEQGEGEEKARPDSGRELHGKPPVGERMQRYPQIPGTATALVALTDKMRPYRLFQSDPAGRIGRI